MSGYCRNKNIKFIMWAMPLEHIMIWIYQNNIKYKYLWILEQDISYSGNIFNFFKKYDKYDEDLIVSSYGIMNNESKWTWKNCFTYQYKKWVNNHIPYNKRILSPTHICRWSSRYIYFMKKNMELKRHSYSEASMVECAYINKLSIRKINNEDIGYKFKYKSRISKLEWKRIMNSNNSINKLYHALKY